MTREKIKNTPEIVDLMLSESVMSESKEKLHKRLEEICNLAIKALEQEPCEDCIGRAEAMTEIQMNARRYTMAKEYGGMGQVEWSDNLISIKDALDILRKLPSVKQESKEWIPVSERLPEHTDYYLIQYSRKICADEMAVAFYSVEEAEVDSDYTWEFKPQCGEYKEVLAWQPLPEPYSEESK